MVNVLSRRQSSPNSEDWKDVINLLRYIRGTVNLGLKYRGLTDEFEGKSDASNRDWKDNTSKGGYLLQLYGLVKLQTSLGEWLDHKV